RVGVELGIALQMLDDLSGVTKVARREKGYEDLRGDRATWVWACAAEVLAPAELDNLRSRALHTEQDLEALRAALARAVTPFAERRIREHVEAALARFTGECPVSSVSAKLRTEAERLLSSYV